MHDAKKGCWKPNELKGKPQECSREQIENCHGDATQHPCSTTGCEKPGNLKGSPKGYSREQITKSHGDAAGHPCVEES